MNFKITSIIMAGLVYAGSSLYAEAVLIAHPKNKLESASADDVKKFFTGKSKKIGSAKLKAAVLKEGSSKDEFLQTYLGMSAQQFQRDWSKLVFTGKAKMPKTVDDDDSMIELVSDSKKYIGFVDKASVTEDVKVIPIQ